MRVRRQYAHGKTIKEMVRDLRLSLKVIRKVIRAPEEVFGSHCFAQPRLRIRPFGERPGNLPLGLLPSTSGSREISWRCRQRCSDERVRCGIVACSDRGSQSAAKMCACARLRSTRLPRYFAASNGRACYWRGCRRCSFGSATWRLSRN